MYICPLCNQLGQQYYKCPNCQKEMEDNGRLMDYFDDYSAYLDIEGMKLFNGYPSDQKNHQCPHVFYCFNCSEEIVYLINEIEY
ncbi:MAG TPA: hypothetical protein GX497_14640 [Bacillus bacterium]|nr:hypothetical protein [Bacillus sp. (in: firmicutes)]